MRSQKRAASEPLGTTHVPVSQPRGTSCRGGPGPGHCVQGGLWESAGRDPSRPCDSSSGSAVSPRTAGTEAAAGERSAPSALGSRERGHLLLFPSTSSPKRPSTRREGRAERGLPQTAPQTPGGSVLFSVAAVQSQLGLWAEATHSLEEAISKGPEGARDDLDIALGQVQKQAPLQPRQVPRGEVFRPHRRHLEHLEPVDFLGKAKVVASAIPDGPHEDARPQQPQALYARGEARPGAAEWARDTGPSRPGTRCGPRAPLDAEMEVSSGQAGRADHSTLVTNDEQKPHVEQVGQRIPPGLVVAGGPGPGSSEDPAGAGGVAAGGPESLVTFTVQCTFTLALRAPRGADLSSLRALMSRALPPQAQSGQLSYRDPSDSRGWVPLTGEEALQRAWRGAAAGSGELRLRCQGVGGRPVLYQVVARHGYSAQGPEDLALQPGDTVDVLCEVDQAWLEGHCDGRVGIFPKCFVVPAGRRT
ncbi:NADPH oxidase activator 1 isoform X1 [Phocoena sinus]|uniref:NADPH oxidase activator 1 isoform X1 n=1 Tax=Phocoena sinus TaxID=42100 RepID=UPI0013C4AF00|nr:NADPH oxidase activator 1 isoform X1 [Phocoena sinus]